MVTGGAAIFKICPSVYNGCLQARVSPGFICKCRACFSRHKRGCARLHCLTQNVGVIYHAGKVARDRLRPSYLHAESARYRAKVGPQIFFDCSQWVF